MLASPALVPPVLRIVETPLRLRAAHRIDFSYLEHVAGGDATYVVLMARMFCTHFPEQLFLAEVAAARADGFVLRQELSRLAITCQLLGLPRLVALVRQLDDCLGPDTAAVPAAAFDGLRYLRKSGMAAMRTLAEELQVRYPQALADLWTANKQEQ